MTTLRISVGERIRAIRKAKGLTQQQLAELSGLDDAYIGSLERGERNFSIDTLEKVIKALKIQTNDLFPIEYEYAENQINYQKALDSFKETINNLTLEQYEILNSVIREVTKAFK
ncbi:helix-turn-helix domain-containing protein [Paenibacillus sp. 1781tsa1]|uniref:helix-turn-helix domain-containing protein n=1 Tax=Paenibacillus sp. 1781tsa1 TaxID=2953810 RepID=UPI00209CEF02|nr:helix-turn-helix transcriptional regulator [Paenibacillus sp. 1781tsa1]MCP1187465.1 helix-turn-helix domain-containing protein [Paenibacillus sp. 1781tsa1]